jgi:hypothetical protein
VAAGLCKFFVNQGKTVPCSAQGLFRFVWENEWERGKCSALTARRTFPFPIQFIILT